MNITQVPPEEAHRLYALEQRCFHHPWKLRGFEEACASSPYWVAQAQTPLGELLGYLVAREVDTELEIHKLATAPEARRQGVGRSLMGAFCEDYLAKGWSSATPVHLETGLNNLAALNFYEPLGFRRSGIRPHYYPCGASAQLLEHTLGGLWKFLSLLS